MSKVRIGVITDDDLDFRVTQMDLCRPNTRSLSKNKLHLKCIVGQNVLELRATLKLLVHSFCADVNVRGGLEICTYRVTRVLATFTHFVPLNSMTLLCNFMWSAHSWLSCSGS